MLKHRYNAVAIVLHWIIAAAILGMIGLGWYMGDLPNDAPNKGALYQLHKSIGIVILAVTLFRIVWRILNRPPEELPAPHWQQQAAALTHFGFYALMVLMPLTGWILVSASTRGLPTVLFNAFPWPHLPFLTDLSVETKKAIHPFLENAHSKLAWVAIVLLVLHVGAALKHQFIDRDGLMSRMAPGLFGRTDGPSGDARGGWLALGVAAVFLIAGIGLGLAPKPTKGDMPATTPAPTSIVANWTIDKTQSRIGFSGDYNGDPYAGEFTDWDAMIAYDPDELPAARIEVTVQTDSATTGVAYNDQSLKSADFFDVANHPTAVFKANGVFALEEPQGALELTAVLTLKGEDYPVRMPFSLAIDGDTATMTSKFTLDRTALNIGMENDPGGDWVAKTVNMDVTVVATRSAE